VNEQSHNFTDSISGCAPEAREDRKPYHKPSFRSEQVFETMALQCGKMQGTSGACNMVKINS